MPESGGIPPAAAGGGGAEDFSPPICMYTRYERRAITATPEMTCHNPTFFTAAPSGLRVSFAGF